MRTPLQLVTLQAFDDFVLETRYERDHGAVARRWCAEHMRQPRKSNTRATTGKGGQE